MTRKDELLQERFRLNMARINGLVQLIFSNDALKPAGLFKSEGARADILRSIVVFLHATFEVVLRSHLPKPNDNLTFNSSADIDRALKRSRIDPKPFKALYPPLTQMAKRRARIVHEADLVKRTATVAEAWGIAAHWQLIMWSLAVPAFYYQLRISIDAADIVESTMHRKIREAMLKHVELGHQLLAVPKLPPERLIEGLQRIADTTKVIAATLKLDVTDRGGNARS